MLLDRQHVQPHWLHLHHFDIEEEESDARVSHRSEKLDDGCRPRPDVEIEF